MSKNTNYYNQIFDYLRGEPTLPASPANAIAFGRKDTLIAEAIASVFRAGLLDPTDEQHAVVISGGIGKDSGDLEALGLSEAEWLKREAVMLGVRPDLIVPEVRAKNGGENVRNSLGLMGVYGLSVFPDLMSIAHATSARRLSETLRHELLQTDITSRIHVVPTEYTFDANNPADQNEARAELLRLADWPSKNWLEVQQDLPENLVDFARDQSE